MCYYIILSILTVFSVVPKLSYNSTVASEYYLGEPLTVRCEPSNIPETGLFILALRIEDEFQIRCQRVGGAWELAPVNSPPAGVTFTPLRKEDCNHVMILILEKSQTRPCLSKKQNVSI